MGQSTALDECMVVSEPLGTVLILRSWACPVQLCLVPLIGAIAAGTDSLVSVFSFLNVSWSVGLPCVIICVHACVCVFACMQGIVWSSAPLNTVLTQQSSFTDFYPLTWIM